MANTWVSSDLHFFHKRIMEFCPNTRPWANVDEMTNGLLDALNATVKSGDTLYLLGDISFGNREQTEYVIKRIPGNKHIVFGNHDPKLRETWADKYFHSTSNLMRHKLFGHDVIMCHYPLRRWEKCHYGSLHLFGHQHGADIGAIGRCMDVGWDAHGCILNMEHVVDTLSKKDVLGHHGGTKI